MKCLLTILIGGSLLFSGITASAQSDRNDFKPVDDYVKSLGSLDSLNMGSISYLVTKKFPDSKDKVRAIFDWIAYNISFDLKAGRNNDNEKSSGDLVLKLRKATPAGYAGLFQDMCSVVKIRCLTVDGYAKYNTEQINEKPEGRNHTWAVVQLGLSPDTWYYIDPTWGAGFTDEKMSKFTKAYNDDYFFANKTIFNLQHYPDNIAWLLGMGPKSQGSFIAMPIVRAAAYDFNLLRFTPENGLIKARPKKAVPFNIKLNTNIPIEIVSLVIGEEKKKKTKTVNHSYSGESLVFTFEFEEEDSYPVTVMINNKPVLTYMAEVSE